MPITDLLIKNLKTTGVRYRKTDGGGLFLEVTATGTKVFRLAYRFGGQQRTLVVGPFPATSLARARFVRESAKQTLRDGADPAIANGAVEPEAPTPDSNNPQLWRNLVSSYLAKRKRGGAAPKTMSKMNLHGDVVIAAFGEKLVGTVTAQHVIKVCQVYEEAGKIHSAHSIRTLCSQVFRFAIAQGFAAYDPAAPARDAMVRLPNTHYPGITDTARVGQLMRAIRVYQGGPVVRASLLLSAYLFPRNSELRGMRWDQIDFDAAIWTVPGAQMKKGREHIVPLPRQVLAVLRDVKPYTGRSDLVLPSRSSGSGLLSDMTFNKALRAMGFPATEHVHHGFRTTASTTLNEQGWNFDWIERQLAHVEGNSTRGAYNKALYLPGRTEMMQAYADLLDGYAADGEP